MNRVTSFSILFFSSFSLFASETPQLYDYCGELPMDTAMKVIIPSGSSKTTTQKYTLLRASENVYDVYLNLRFKASKKYDGDITDKNELNETYKSAMNSCFRRMENKLVDELGRKLRLHVYDKTKDKKLPSAPPLVKIKVMDEEHRSHSFAYNSKIDCPTLIHETFHLLGLVDEYEEKWKGFNHKFISLAFNPIVETSDDVLPAYDCRAIGPSISVMRNQWSLLWRRGLYSAHVNAIIYPNCDEKNKKYYTCAKYAYKTSAANNGALPNIGDCAKRVPDYCKSEDWVQLDRN
jgi:hypothetical protein